MKSKLIIAVAFVAITLLLGGFISSINASSDNDCKDEQKRTIQISGTSTLSESPNKATFTVTVNKESNSAKFAQDNIKERMNSVIKALKAKGVKEKDMKTVTYEVRELREWEKETRKYVFKGYKATHKLLIETRDLDKVGTLADAASDAGADEIGSISFGLTDETRSELRIKAYKAAAQDAKKRAEAIASGLEVKLGKPISVTERYRYYPRYYAEAEVSALAAGAPAEEPTPIIAPEEVKLSVTLQATFEIV